MILFVLALISWTLPSPSLASRSFLLKGSSLSVEADEAFTCGFYEVGSNAFAFSICFSGSSAKTTVWIANRDRPVDGRVSTLTLRKDGSLVVTDADDAVAWSTNTSSTPADRAELLNSGNLAVKDDRGHVLWRSFDSPTDTLLPAQPITETTSLVSAAARGSVASGYYNLYFDNDNVLKQMYNGPEISSIYWPIPDNNVWANGRTSFKSSRFGVLDAKGGIHCKRQIGFESLRYGWWDSKKINLGL